MTNTKKQILEQLLKMAGGNAETVLNASVCDIQFKIDNEHVIMKLEGSGSAINSGILMLISEVCRQADMTIDEYLAELSMMHMLKQTVESFIHETTETPKKTEHCGKCSKGEASACKH